MCMRKAEEDSPQAVNAPDGNIKVCAAPSLGMRVYPWLLVLALVPVCFTWRMLSHLISDSTTDRELPYLTRLVFHFDSWVMLSPLFWATYAALLSFRKKVTPGSLFMFTGLWLLAMTVLLCALALASALPWIPIKALIGTSPP